MWSDAVISHTAVLRALMALNSMTEMALLDTAPLYLRTLWRYTNAIIIIIIIIYNHQNDNAILTEYIDHCTHL